MKHLQKVLLAATVLTALCTTAFASDNMSPEAKKPTMTERVNAILHKNEAPANCPAFRHHHQRRAHHDLRPYRGPKEHRKLTPEQRKEYQQYRKDHKKWYKERMAGLTSEQHKQIEDFIEMDRKHRSERRKAWQQLSPEQKELLRHKNSRPKMAPPHHRALS